MRIVFIGAVEFSSHCLDEVVRAGGNVVAVITLEDDRKSRHSDFGDVGTLAESRQIRVHRVRRVSTPDNIELIRSLRPDVIFVFGWSELICSQILSIPRLGCIGTHPALLPKNRGRHPLVWALVKGLTESGLTFLYLDEGADSGDILWQRPFSIELTDDAASLYEKIKSLASIAISEFLPSLENGTANRIPQDHEAATYWRKRDESDGEINWRASAMQSYNLIRALTRPYVGAHTSCDGERVVVWRAGLPTVELDRDNHAREPGAVLRVADKLAVRTADAYLTLLEYDTNGLEPLKPGNTLGAVSCAS